MALTNKEIAKKLNISETSLSFIINNKPGIAEKTRARVIRELTELGYSHILKKEVAALSGSLGFIVYKRHGKILSESPFFMLLMEEIDEKARAAGYNLMVRILDASDSVADEIKAMNGSDISGLIVFATEMLDDDMEKFTGAAMPVVAMDNDFSHLEVDSVVINNKVGTFKAIEHLVGLGHKKIGYLQCTTRINSFQEREDGYRKALARFGLDLAPEHVFPLGFTEQASYQDFREILRINADLPTAFVSDSDPLAAGAMRALIEHGIAVPDDVSVLGFDDRPLCQVIVPHLSSILVPSLLGSQAVDLLVEKINTPVRNAVDYRKIEVGVSLVARASTSAAPKSATVTTA